jgi:hypothetical protein
LFLLLWAVVALGGGWAFLHLTEPNDDVGPRAHGSGGDEDTESAADAPKRRHTSDEAIDVEQARKDLKKENPDYVGLGNSMMFTRLGYVPKEISTLTRKKFFFLYKNGSDTPIWYLMLKNIVVPSGARPKGVILFVRNNELTAPFTRPKGGTQTYLNSLRAETEPALDTFMHRQSPASADFLQRWFTFPQSAARGTRRLTEIAMDLGLGGNKKALRLALGERFGLDHLRSDVAADMADSDVTLPAAGGYSEEVLTSLLPEMLKLTRQIGAKLIVFRVKRRPDAVTHLPDEPPVMQSYAKFMDQWLKEQGAVFYDESYDLSIRLSDYRDGDHINSERRPWYQDYFWQRMKEHMP